MFDGLATNCKHPKGGGRTSLVDASPLDSAGKLIAG